MQRTGIRPDQFTFSSVLPACGHLATLKDGKEIHQSIIKSGFEYDVVVGSALVDMYVKCRKIEDARHVFDEIPQRNVVSWNTIIAGYAQSRLLDESLNLFQQMPERDVVSWNVIIAGYAQNGHVDEAVKLFEKMPKRDVVAWTSVIAGYAQDNAIIAGYAQNGYFRETLKFYRQMQLTGVKPDSDTFASILPACANSAALEHGKKVHEDIIRRGFQSDVFVGSALVDMYAKCGSIENARHVFDKMPKRNVVSWTAMIAGYAMHGYGKEALQLFEHMRYSGTNPDHVTFVGVLSACCHAGLLDKGWQYFNIMSRDYNITPTVKHYCCMVDLLGRAGHLDEAQRFINKMPIKPDAAVWVSLLGACKIHTNIERAAGRWNDIENVRHLMKDVGVKKKPGCSWIEVNNKVYAFLV